MGTSAQPAAPAGQHSLLADMLDFVNVLHEPDAVFARIKERARILAPWILLSIVLVVMSILTRPYQQAAMEAFKATLTPEQAARMGDRSGGGGIIGLALTPLGVLAFLAAGAGLLWIGVSVTGTQARFKTLMSVLAYSCVTYVLFAVIGMVVLTLRGKASVTGFADLRAPLGLDLLIANVGLYGGQVLNAINPFSVWGVWLTGTGISITHGISKGTAIVVTAVVYLLGVMIMSAPLLLMGLATRQ